MQVLKCDRCGVEYADSGSIELAKRTAIDWRLLAEMDGGRARGLIPCPFIQCQGELILQHMPRRPPTTQKEVLERYPRQVAHMICESLGYFTPEAAANALLDYIQGKANWCEWYIHMAQGFNTDKLLKVGRQVVERAFRSRHHHRGYMAHYPLARALVEHVRAGGKGPIFASWF